MISAPLLQLRLEVPAWKRAMGQVAARLFTTLSLPSGLEPSQLTHDPAEAQAYATDPLVFRTATAGWFAAVQRAQAEAWKDLPKLTTGRYLFLLPEADPVCDTPTAQRFYAHLPASQRALRLYPEAYHELLHETFRTKVFQDIAEYLSAL
jgi:lysophospholipase